MDHNGSLERVYQRRSSYPAKMIKRRCSPKISTRTSITEGVLRRIHLCLIYWMTELSSIESRQVVARSFLDQKSYRNIGVCPEVRIDSMQNILSSWKVNLVNSLQRSIRQFKLGNLNLATAKHKATDETYRCSEWTTWVMSLVVNCIWPTSDPWQILKSNFKGLRKS